MVLSLSALLAVFVRVHSFISLRTNTPPAKRRQFIILTVSLWHAMSTAALCQNFEIGPFDANIILYQSSPLPFQVKTIIEKISTDHAIGHVQGIINAFVPKQPLNDKIQEIAKHFLPYRLNAARCDITVADLHSTSFDVVNYTGFFKTTAVIQTQGIFCFLKSGDYELSIRFVPLAKGASVDFNIVDVSISSPESIVKHLGVDKVIADKVRNYAAALGLTVPDIGDGVKAAFQGANVDADKKSIILAVRMDAQADSGSITQLLKNSGAMNSINLRYPTK